MNWIADESVDRQIVERLRMENHSVFYVAEMTPSISDEKVLSIADKESTPLITSDKDFGELVFRQNIVSSGVVLIRLAGLSSEISLLFHMESSESEKFKTIPSVFIRG